MPLFRPHPAHPQLRDDQDLPPHQARWARTRAQAVQVSRHPFLAKVKEDDLPLLAPLLAFNVLMSLVPLLVLLSVLLGFVLRELPSQVRDHLITLVSARSTHGQFLALALYRLKSMTSWAVVLIVVLPSFWFGAELFVAIERCFMPIFHIPARPFLQQRLMALRLLGLFIVLIPTLLIVAALPTQLKSTTLSGHGDAALVVRLVFLLATFLIDWLIGSIFYLVIYLVIPKGHMRHVWKGTLIAGALLALYVIAFPFLNSGDLSPQNDATNAAFALAMLGFFYFFSIFLLLGAEINAYWGGTPSSLPASDDESR